MHRRPRRPPDGVSAAPVSLAAGASARLPSVDVVGPVVGQLLEDATGPVNGYLDTRNRSDTKTDSPLIRVPQAVTTIAADPIEAQNATTLSQALRYTSGCVPKTAAGPARIASVC